MTDDTRPVNPPENPGEMRVRHNIAALLTDAADRESRDGDDVLWSYTLSQRELAEAASVFAGIVVGFWLAHGAEPSVMIEHLVAANLEAEG